jgi:hypothetical protein
MITYTIDRSSVSRHRSQHSLLSPLGWYFVFALFVASSMGAALAFAN